MAERRSLVEGIKNAPTPIEQQRENESVYAGAKKGDKSAELAVVATAPTPTLNHARSPISTRILSDFATALKRAALERQLNKIEPNTLQDILEEAIEPWVKSNGYLS
jgi:hypothetical protein